MNGIIEKYAKPSVMVAILGIVLPVGFTMLIGQLFAFLGKKLFPWVSFSSNVGQHFSRVLRELNVLSSKEGATILGASVVDDIVVVIILSVAVGMIGASTGGNENQLYC